MLTSTKFTKTDQNPTKLSGLTTLVPTYKSIQAQFRRLD